MPAIIPDVSPLLLAMDLTGIFIFGLTGGTLAVRHRLDIFGVMVLALVTALAGGVLRDLLIGAIPPATMQDERYLITALASGLFAFFFHPFINRLVKPVMVLDAAGLGIFAVAGCGKALAYGLGFTLALLLMAAIRERLDTCRLPKAMAGTPLALVMAGLLSLAFMGFKGMG